MPLLYEMEYNDERVLANRFDSQIQGSLKSVGDIDWFTFSNNFPTQLKVTFTFGSSPGLWNVQLMDEKAQVLSGRNIGASFYPGTDKFVYDVPAFSVGDYFFRISQPNIYQNSGAPYTISVERPNIRITKDSYSYNEGTKAVVSIEILGDESYIGSYSTYYKISGVSSSDIEIPLEGSIGIANGKGSLIIPLASDQTTEGEERLSVEFGRWSGGIGNFVSQYASLGSTEFLVQDTSVTPTPSYILTAVSPTVVEGSVASFYLSTTNSPTGDIPFEITGVTVSDIVGGNLRGNASINLNGNATINVPITADNLTEGDEILTVTVQGKSASTIIKDTSQSTPTTAKGSLTILVDKGVLGPSPFILKALPEEITSNGNTVTSHLIIYNGVKFNYADVDALITTVVRNGNFTDEFRNEILDLAPNLKDVKYEDLVKLVGVGNIDNVILNVAGADGNFVG